MHCTERIGSKKNNLRGERRSSGSRASYRSRYGRFSCTDMKFSRSIQFSQSRMVSGSSVPRSAVALTNVSSTFIASKTSLSSAMNSSARPVLTCQFLDPVQRRLPSLLSTDQLLYCSDERPQLFLSQ